MRRCPKCTDVAGYLCGVTGPLLPEGDSMQFIYHFDIAALAIGFIIMADYASKNTIKSRQTRAFLHILHMAVLASAFDLGSTFALHYASVLPLWFNDFLLIGFNITFHALTPLYLYYVIMCVKKPDEKLSEKELVYILGLYAADMAMLFTNKFTKFVYYIDENYEYHSGMGAKVSYDRRNLSSHNFDLSYQKQGGFKPQANYDRYRIFGTHCRWTCDTDTCSVGASR